MNLTDIKARHVPARERLECAYREIRHDVFCARFLLLRLTWATVPMPIFLICFRGKEALCVSAA